MTVYLANAFSLNMLDIGAEGVHVVIQPILPTDVLTSAKSIIGHADMAAILSDTLNRQVEVNRESVILLEGDILFVVQYRGPRLPAGATILPANARLEFFRILLQRVETFAGTA